MSLLRQNREMFFDQGSRWRVCRTVGVISLFLFFATAVGQTRPAPDQILRIDKPTTEVALRSEFRFLNLRTASAGKHVVAHLQLTKDATLSDAVVAFDLSTGKPFQVLETKENLIMLYRAIDVSPKDSTVFFWSEEGPALAAMDIKTAEKRWIWQTPAEGKVDSGIRFNVHSGCAATTIGESSVIVWNLATGHSQTTKLNFLDLKQGFIVVPCDEHRIFLITPSGNSAAKYSVDLVDLTTLERSHLTQVDSGLACNPLPNCREAIVLQGKSTGWTAIERWDIDKHKLVSTFTFRAPIPAPNLRITADGRFFFMHDNRKPVTVWDVKNNRIAAIVGPAEGLDNFDITPDGKTLVATHSTFREDEKGKQTPPILVTFDLTRLIQPEAIP